MTLDMNPEIRAQWCAALRSGDYPQTREALRRAEGEGQNPPGFCCLGVLTDLWLKAGNDEMVADEYADDGDDEAVPYSVWAAPEGLLSRPVVQWAGLGDSDPQLGPDPVRGGASVLNDGGKTFAQIADLIDGGAS